MKRMTILTLLFAATACATSAPPPRTSAVGIRSTKADFAKYGSFGFGSANPPGEGYQISDRSMTVQTKLAPLVRSMLEARGYTLQADRPDLVIRISAGSRVVTGEGWPDGIHDSTVGLIGFDAYDGQSGAYVWHATALAEIDREPIDDALLARGLERMLVDFPARPPTASSAVVPESQAPGERLARLD